MPHDTGIYRIIFKPKSSEIFAGIVFGRNVFYLNLRGMVTDGNLYSIQKNKCLNTHRRI